MNHAVLTPRAESPIEAGTLEVSPRTLARAKVAIAGLVIVVLQVSLVSIFSIATGASHKAGVYDSLCRWDGNLYVQIAERGYHGEPPGIPVDFQKSNVAFFPGYPLAARWLHDLSGGRISFRAAMVLSAQLAAWGFWIYWLLMLRRLAAPRAVALSMTLLLAAHPAAYYLVVAYSESLFLMMALGFLYWATSRNRWALPLAAAHGFAMTATRMGGVPIALSPLAAQALLLLAPSAATSYASGTAAGMSWLSATRRGVTRGLAELWAGCSVLTQLTALAAIAVLGVVSFFAYCQWAFGAWDLYMQTQKAGWNLSADWLWWTNRVNYAFLVSTWHPNIVWPDDVSRFTVLATLALFIGLAGYELKLASQGDRGWQRRLVFYLAAWGLFFLHAAGVSPIQMKSMIRYSLGVHVLLALAIVQFPLVASIQSLSRRQLACVIGLAGLLLALQCAMLWRFFMNEWVA